MKQKGQSAILILLGILIMVGVAGGAYFLGRQTSPKPQNPVVTSSPQSTMVPQNTPSSVVDGTANWKTYEGQYYPLGKFSIKYPPDYNICSEDPQSGGVAIVSSLDCPAQHMSNGRPAPKEGSFALNIYVNYFGNQMSLKQLVDEAASWCNFNTENSTSYMIDGREAYIFTEPYTCPEYIFELFTKENNLFYIIKVSSGVDVTYTDIQPKIYQIIATFKFLK